MAARIEETGTAEGGCSARFPCAPWLSKGEGLPLRRDYETNLTHRKCLPPGWVRSEKQAHICSYKSYCCACCGLSARGLDGGRPGRPWGLVRAGRCCASIALLTAY